MKSSISLYSSRKNEINSFLNSFYNKEIQILNDLKHNILFENPIEMVDLIAAYVENNDKYKINMWISIDKGIFINVTQHNADKIIRYIYERFPY